MGAWIETARRGRSLGIPLVAPYMGAWIETVFPPTIGEKVVCRALYGCVD